MKTLFIMVRWLLAGGCLYLAWKLVFAGFAVIIAMGMLIAAILLISPETALKVAQWFGDRFVGFIYPDDRFAKPPLNYTLARYYRRWHRTEEAIGEYEKIIRYYPKEKDAYVELLTLAMHEGEDQIYQKYAKKARRRFGCEIEIVQPPPIFLPNEKHSK